MLGRKGNNNTTIKTNSTTRRDKSESTGERRKTKKITRQDQTIQTNRTFQNNEKKIIPASKWRMYENIPTSR